MGEPALRRYSYSEYLELEQASVTKNEYFNGHILAMSGGAPLHGFLSAAVIGELRVKLHGKPCAPHTSDTRIRVLSANLSTYPDASVICGKPERAPEDRDSLTNPTVLVEVLSKSTEAYDRGEKFHQYQKLPSLRDYVLINHGTARIEHFERGEDGWLLRTAGQGESVELKSIGCVLCVDAVYDGAEAYRE